MAYVYKTWDEEKHRMNEKGCLIWTAGGIWRRGCIDGKLEEIWLRHKREEEHDVMDEYVSVVSV